jgi:hypothetical protein
MGSSASHETAANRQPAEEEEEEAEEEQEDCKASAQGFIFGT